MSSVSVSGGAASAAARATAVAAKGPIGDLGGVWMSSPLEEAAGEAAGFDDWQLYFLGRHGVLGDVDPEVVRAAAYVFSADRVRDQWASARSAMTPAEATAQYLAICHQWGREELAGFAGADRLAELGRRVVDHADVVAMPLLAGWCALPVPPVQHGSAENAAERCAQVCQLLREHRGACHGVALAALNLPPLLAILTNGGEENALEYGWLPPFPTPTDDDRALRDRVEQLTDDIVAVGYDALTEQEQQELLELLTSAHRHAFGPE